MPVTDVTQEGPNLYYKYEIRREMYVSDKHTSLPHGSVKRLDSTAHLFQFAQRLRDTYARVS